MNVRRTHVTQTNDLPATDVHTPLAHARLLFPQLWPEDRTSQTCTFWQKKVFFVSATVGCKNIRRARRRVSGARLGSVTRRVLRRATHLRRGCKRTLIRTTGATLGVTSCPVDELTGSAVAASRSCPCAWITVFALLHDAVATHLECDDPMGIIGID